MLESSRRIPRRAAFAALCALIVLILLPVVAGALIDAGFFHKPILTWIEGHARRPVRVNGRLDLHLLSLHPRLNATDVVIENPPWAAPGVLARIGRAEMQWEVTVRRGPRLDSVELDGADFGLVRDARGATNWSARPPGSQGQGPPLMHHLHISKAHVRLDDQRRHLEFDGTVAIGELREQALRLDAHGSLNGRPVAITLDGDALARARRDTPWHFRFDEQSSGSRLTGSGAVLQPFDFHALDVDFAARGADLKDLYYLTGLSLPNTGSYALNGRLERRGRSFAYRNLAVDSGQSDMQGSIDVESGDGQAHVHATLHSRHLRSADIGARAAGRAPAPAGPPRALSDTPIPLKGIRRANATVDFKGDTVEIGRMPFRHVSTHVRIADRKLTASSIAARFAGGTIRGHGVLDAAHDPPRGRLDLRARSLELAELPHRREGAPAERAPEKSPAKDSPVSGELQARLQLAGAGDSLHALAASSNGALTAVIPHGMMRSSLAELSGLDLKGLGLAMGGNKRETEIRCAVAEFTASSGVLNAKRIVIDTEPVLIQGEGLLDLRNERFDLTLHGRPKHPRFRVRAPVVLGGTLLHPSFGAGKKQGIAQAGAAVALGAVLTPLAAALAFVDPGLAKNENCAALIEETELKQPGP